MSKSNLSFLFGKSNVAATASGRDATLVLSMLRDTPTDCTVMGGREKTSGCASSAATSSPSGATFPANVQFSRRSAPELSTKTAPPERSAVLDVKAQLRKAAAVGRSLERALLAWMDHAAPVAERKPVKRHPATHPAALSALVFENVCPCSTLG